MFGSLEVEVRRIKYGKEGGAAIGRVIGRLLEPRSVRTAAEQSQRTPREAKQQRLDKERNG